MDFSLSDEQKALRENIVRFAREVLNEGVIERDRAQAFPRELWRRCGEIGIQGLPVPEEFGGSGLDPLSTAIAQLPLRCCCASAIACPMCSPDAATSCGAPGRASATRYHVRDTDLVTHGFYLSVRQAATRGASRRSSPTPGARRS